MKSVPPELKSYKEEFDFIHKKIGDLEWELATIYLGRKAILGSDIEKIEAQLENYKIACYAATCCEVYAHQQDNVAIRKINE